MLTAPRPSAWALTQTKWFLAAGAGRKSTRPYVQEHADLIKSIREKKPLNELKAVAEGTLTAIMGRMSAYTGKEVAWEKALKCQENLMPEKATFDSKIEVPPVAVPGQTEIKGITD